MKSLPLLSRSVLLSLGVALLSARATAQDVGAGTVIDLPTPAGVNIRADLAYDAAPHQKLDLYLPTGRFKQARPVIVYLHGGGWRKGGKADGRRLAFRFVAQGYAVACVDYRLSSDALFPAQLEDTKAAVRWLRSNAERNGLDRDRIGVIGVSAGGHLAALMGAMNSTRLYETGAAMDQHSRIQAVVDFFGPIDLVQMFDAAQKTGAPIASEITQLLGGDPHQVPVPASASNPARFLDQESPPYLIIHGDNDTVIPPEQSRLLYDALVNRHVTAHLHLIHGAGHTGPAFIAPDINAIVDDFLEQTLKRAPDASDLKPVSFTESTAAKN